MLQAVRAPLSHPVAIEELRPTQMTVGLREVGEKVKLIQERLRGNDDKVEKKSIIPVVEGPKNHFYIIDHHHLCRALLQAGLKQVLVTVVLKLTQLEKGHFWVVLDNKGLVHPFDADGERCGYSELPKSVEDMKDDPFRSLAGALRRRGGYAKDTTPFSEFLWADYLRRKIERKLVVEQFDAAMARALEIAKGKDADFLPGWCGAVADDED